MRNFFIELIEVKVKEDHNAFYPRVAYSQGEVPVQKENLSEMNQEDFANKLLQDAGFNNDGDEPDDDIFEGFDDFENFQ